MSFSFDVVNGLSLDWLASSQAVLAQMFIPLQDTCTSNIPLTTISTLMPSFAILMLLPPFVSMLLAVSRAIRSCSCASTLSACSFG
ncbi:hypothetical protein A3464_00070 [Enterobacter genomosp. O]|nr:hypothetical protein A3464_00070 [Enterobacter genomosp. O]